MQIVERMKSIRIYLAALLLCLAGGVYCHADATENMPVQELAQQQASIEIQSGSVKVINSSDAPVDVAVFAITGTVVKQACVDAGDELTIELPAGYYIVKAGSSARRVAVK